MTAENTCIFFDIDTLNNYMIRYLDISEDLNYMEEIYGTIYEGEENYDEFIELLNEKNHLFELLDSVNAFNC
jgi:hypothetical protein